MKTMAAISSKAVDLKNKKVITQGQCGKPSKIVDKALNRFWVLMGVKYGHKWSSQFTTKAIEDIAKEAWAKELAVLTMDDIRLGLENVTNEFPSWPPSMGEFKLLCRVQKDHGFPTLEDAWLEICSSKDYVNGIVLAMARDSRVCHYDWVRLPWQQGLKKFKPIYDDFIKRGLAGEEFPLVTQFSLDDRVGLAVTDEEKQACRESAQSFFKNIKSSLKRNLSTREKLAKHERYLKFRSDLSRQVSQAYHG